MAAVIRHPDVGTQRIITTLEAEAPLMAMTVTIRGTVKPLQGVRYLAVRQEDEGDGPWIIIGPPISAAIAKPINGNGPEIAQASFLQDIRVAARDVEPNNAGLVAICAYIQGMRQQFVGNVTGGRANSVWVVGWTPDQRIDRGGYVYSEVGITFRIASSTT